MDNFFKERKDYQRYIIDYLVDENKWYKEVKPAYINWDKSLHCV